MLRLLISKIRNCDLDCVVGAELGQLTLTLSGTPGFRLLLFAPLCQNPLAFEDQQQQFYTNIISPPLPLIYVWFIVFVCVCSLCILLYSLLAFHLFNSHQLSFNKYILGDIHHLAWSFIYFYILTWSCLGLRLWESLVKGLIGVYVW